MKDIMAELEIMTDNLRNMETTPTLKKSFSYFEPDDYNLQEGDVRVYIDPKSLQGLHFLILRNQPILQKSDVEICQCKMNRNLLQHKCR